MTSKQKTLSPRIIGKSLFKYKAIEQIYIHNAKTFEGLTP